MPGEEPPNGIDREAGDKTRQEHADHGGQWRGHEEGNSGPAGRCTHPSRPARGREGHLEPAAILVVRRNRIHIGLMSSAPLPASEARAQARAARDGTIVADLSHNALIEVSGDDATAFLHAQFTNDVQALAQGAAQWNGWCSAKGRLLATFLLVKRAQGYLLLLPMEIAAPIGKRLGMFVLRSKVKIADASD